MRQILSKIQRKTRRERKPGKAVKRCHRLRSLIKISAQQSYSTVKFILKTRKFRHIRYVKSPGNFILRLRTVKYTNLCTLNYRRLPGTTHFSACSATRAETEKKKNLTWTLKKTGFGVYVNCQGAELVIVLMTSSAPCRSLNIKAL